MQIVIYSTATCPYCQMLKSYLQKANIAFNEKLVDQDDAAREEMMQESGGFLGVPFTVVTKDDGTKSTIVGFDKGKLSQLLNINQ